MTQGSRFASTLGWRTQSLWGWRLTLLVVFLFAFAVQAKNCVETACVQISSRTVSVSSERGTLLNAVASEFLDSPVNVTSSDWQTLAQTPINLQSFAEKLQARTGAPSLDAALASDVALTDVFAAMKDVFVEQGQIAAADSTDLLLRVAANAGGTIRLSDMIDACADCGSLKNTELSALDFFSGSLSLYNYENGPNTPTPVTISGSSLGLGDTVNSIEIYASATEPPRIICGPAGTQFFSSANRYKFAVDLVDKNVSGDVAAQMAATGVTLPAGVTDMQVQLGRLEFYAVSGRAEGVIQSVDELSKAVTLRAKPGVVDMYLGRIPDAVFFDKTRTINLATDLQFGDIGTLTANLAGTPITAQIRGKSSAQGQSSSSTTLVFTGPYPQTQTVSTSPGFADSMTQELMNNLELEIVMTEPATADPATQTLFGTLVTTIKPSMVTVFQQALSPVISTLVLQVLNPMMEASGMRFGEADITVLSVNQDCSFNISGHVYYDLNRSASRDESESGTGMALYAKLMPASSTNALATHLAVVDPATGAFQFTNVLAGMHIIVIHTNATMSDVTPVTLPGWTGTEMPSMKREQVIVSNNDVSRQNFGLSKSVTLTGTVFRDNGAGGGVANDGVKDVSEIGLSGVTVKLTGESGATIYDTATTDGSGNYTLHIPSAVAGGVKLKVVETNPKAHQSTGASVGNTGGSYDCATDTITFTHTANTPRAGANFGDVPESRLLTDGQQAGLPGSAVFYTHAFIAGSTGTVTFTGANEAAPANNGWSHVFYRDLNCDGKIDSGEPIVTGALNIVADEKICLIVKEFIPASAPFNAQDKVMLTAHFTFANTSPALATTLTRTDLTTVGTPTTAGLTLTKSVDKPSAAPGEVITYTLTYANHSTERLNNIVIHDATPAFTTFVSATAEALPQSLTAADISNPTIAARGAVRWTFTGTLAPGSTGTVRFQVRLE